MDGFLTCLKENQSEIIWKILKGKYKPNPVRRAYISKEKKGKVRKLGIPTVAKRLIQKEITPKLMPCLNYSSQRTVMGSGQEGAGMTH